MTFRTRFAPSPTGPLHLGHAYSALLAHDLAVKNNGQFFLRIEDIDRVRSKPDWEQQIYSDLHWLDLKWPEPVMRQSERLAAYSAALDRLWSLGLLYPCTCSRRDIETAMSAPQEGATSFGPDGLVYPGTCRPDHPGNDRQRPTDVALRLDVSRAVRFLKTETLEFMETGQGPTGDSGHIRIPIDRFSQMIGDVVLARRDMGTSYHLSVVLDDTEQGITHVVRGEDLFEATVIHVLLQRLLGIPTPTYHHHRLIRDSDGKRLAKRDDARAIEKYRQDGATPLDIRAMIGL